MDTYEQKCKKSEKAEFEAEETKHCQLLSENQPINTNREDSTVKEYDNRPLIEKSIPIEEGSGNLEDLRGSNSQLNNSVHSEETLEYLIETIKALKYYLELENKYQSTIGDPDEIYIGLSRKLDKDLIYGEFSFYLSVHFIISIKNSELNKKSFSTYLRCLNQLLPYLKNENTLHNEIATVLSRLQALIFSGQPELNDNHYCILSFKTFLEKNIQFIPDLGYQILIKTMKIIDESLRFFEDMIEDETEIDLINSWIYKTTACLHKKCFEQLEILDLFFQSLEIRYNKLQNKSADVLNYIKSLKFTNKFSISSLFAESIDELIIPLAFQCIEDSKSFDHLQAECDFLLDKNASLLEMCYGEYLETEVYTLPEIDYTLCWSLSNILRLPLKKFLIPLCKAQHSLYKQHLKPIAKSFIRRLSYFPANIQYIIIEMLMESNDDYLGFEFALTKANPQLFYKLIDNEWANDFVEIATKAPYSNILTKFNTSKADLQRILPSITHNIVIMKLPEKLYGFNLRNSNIVLKKFKDCAEAKAATFVVYLHELAHLLQRLSCGKVTECISPKSMNNFNEKEGGYLLEKELFGQRLFLLTEDAASFILSDNIPESIDEFKQILLKEINMGMKKKLYI